MEYLHTFIERLETINEHLAPLGYEYKFIEGWEDYIFKGDDIVDWYKIPEEVQSILDRFKF